MKGKDFIIVGAISGALAVLIGAFGSHWLRDMMTAEEMNSFQTASKYHFIHSLALLFAGYYGNRKQSSKSLAVASYLFISGILLFCTSLYATRVFPTWWMASVPPLGGLSFVGGWISIAIDAAISRVKG